MKFSSPISYTGLLKYSNNNKLLAYSKANNIYVYETESLELYTNFSFQDIPSKIEWSYNSDFLLVSFFAKSQVEIKSLNQNDFFCRIDEKLYGIQDAFFSPYNTKILIFNDFSLGVKVYDLNINNNTNNNNNNYFKTTNPDLTLTLPNPKTSSLNKNVKAYRYSKSKSLIYFFHRIDLQDYISIYKFTPVVSSTNTNNTNTRIGSETLSLISLFSPKTLDMEEASFTNDELFIIIFDSKSNNLIVITDILGTHKKTIQPYQDKIGYTDYTITTSYIAIGFYDEVIRVYHSTSFLLIMELKVNQEKISLKNDVFCFKENSDCSVSEYELIEEGMLDLSYQSNTVLEKNDKFEGKKSGFSFLQFSLNEVYMVAVNKRLPNLVFIWNAENGFCLFCVVVQNYNITDMRFMFGNSEWSEVVSNSKEFGSNNNNNNNNNTNVNSNVMSIDSLRSQLLDRNSVNSNEMLFNLAIATETKNVYLIKPSEASVCPLNFNKKDNCGVRFLSWSYDCSSMICSNISNFFFAKLLNPEEHIEEENYEEEENEEDENNSNKNDSYLDQDYIYDEKNETNKHDRNLGNSNNYEEEEYYDESNYNNKNDINHINNNKD